MAQRIKCAKCGKSYRITQKLAGKRVKCRGCQAVIAVPALRPIASEHDFVAALGESIDAAQHDDSISQIEDAAQSNRPGSIARTKFSQKASRKKSTIERAQKYVEKLKKTLPPVPSAYKPSGQVAAASSVWLPIGVAASVPACVLGAVIGLVIGVIVIFLGLAALAMMAVRATGDESGIEAIVYLASSGTAWAVVFSLFASIPGGITASYAFDQFNRLGRNRNRKISAVLCGFAGGLGHVVLYFLTTLIIPDPPLVAAFVVPGVIAGAITGACMGYGHVGNRKYCENCDAWMKSIALPQVTLGAAKELIRVVGARRYGPLVGVYRHGQGEDCRTLLYHCESCNTGILESTVNIEIEIPAESEEDSDDIEVDSWIIASQKLAAADTKALSELAAQLA